MSGSCAVVSRGQSSKDAQAVNAVVEEQIVSWRVENNPPSVTVCMFSIPHSTTPPGQVTRSQYGRTRRLSHLIRTALGGGPHVNGSHHRVIQVCTTQIDEVDEVYAVNASIHRSTL